MTKMDKKIISSLIFSMNLDIISQLLSKISQRREIKP